jgi:hypothetical protein
MTIINHTITESPLDEVVMKFDQWRATREKRGPIPDELWALVSPLEKKYSLSKMTQALRLNSTQLKQGLSSVKTSPPQAMTIVECSMSPILPIQEHHSATLIFSCKNGRPVTLNGLRGNDIAAAITSLVRG